jgi:hypothetical protein
VELDLRNIKTTLGTETLHCKTPEMAIKELWVYLLAYNLIRLLMAQAALLADQIPRQLSFKHTVQIWISWQQHGGGTHDAVAVNALPILIAEPRVGLRPGRLEPRAVKRRPKPFPRLTKPRQVAREEIRQHGTRKSSAECLPILALVHRRNAMIYRASGLNSVPFGSDPFLPMSPDRNVA